MRPTIAALAAALAACAGPRNAAARPLEAPARSGPYSLQVVDEGGAPLPTFEHRGRTYVLGRLGVRYLLRVRNDTPRRAEVVASVDGLDVVDGRPAALGKRGYLVEPWSEVTIDGFRVSEGAVAAFRFSNVPRSYAALTGDARDVGVIGVAVFLERAPRWRPQPSPRPYEDRPSEPRSEQAPARAGEGSPSAAQAPPAGAEAGDLSRKELDVPGRRPGLGTEFGEEHGSPVRLVRFERESAAPAVMLTVRYDDRAGLLAAGVDVDRWLSRRDEAWLRETAEPFRRDGDYARPPPGWAR